MSGTERSFGEIHFGGAELGNKARSRRMVKVADAVLRHPGGTLPHKLKDPAALQALYRLLQRSEVTHASVLAAHQAETFRRIEEHAGPLLAISDATELDYSGLHSLEDLGQIGNGAVYLRGGAADPSEAAAGRAQSGAAAGVGGAGLGD